MITATYAVPGMTCQHCVDAVTKELTKLGVTASIDLESKLVTVTGNVVDDTSVRAAIDEAGFDVA